MLTSTATEATTSATSTSVFAPPDDNKKTEVLLTTPDRCSEYDDLPDPNEYMDELTAAGVPFVGIVTVVPLDDHYADVFGFMSNKEDLTGQEVTLQDFTLAATKQQSLITEYIRQANGLGEQK